jgi:putative inorganic carbon (hco3(-)) transporter
VPVALLVVTFLPLSIFGRLVSSLDLQQASNFDRIRMTQAGIEMIRDHPVFGVGPANVKGEYALYRKQDAPRPRPPHLHNNIVQLWAERGVLALAAYVALLALFLRECLKEWGGPRKMWSQAGVVMTVSLTIAGLFEFNFGDTEVFYLLLNLMAYVLVSMESEVEAGRDAVVPAG